MKMEKRDKIRLIEHLSTPENMLAIAKALHEIEYGGYCWELKQGVKYAVGIKPEVSKRREKMQAKARTLLAKFIRNIGLNEREFHFAIYDIVPEEVRLKRKLGVG